MRSETKKLIPNPETKDIVIRIYDLYIKGNSYQTISNIMNNENILEKKWYDSTIQKILENTIYKGDFIHGQRTSTPEYYENVVEPLVSKELWEECQNQKGKNSRSYTRTIKYLFLQKLKCPNCGTILAGRSPGGKKKDKYIYYRCASCNEYVREDFVEEKLFPQILEFIEYDMIVNNYFAPLLKNKIDNPNEVLQKELNTLQSKKDRLKQAYLNEIIELEEYKEDLKEIEIKIEDINFKINDNNKFDSFNFEFDDLMVFRDSLKIDNLKTGGLDKENNLAWNFKTREEKQNLIMKYIENIEISKNTVSIVIENINYRKSFLTEYSDLVKQGVVDIGVSVRHTSDNSLGKVELSYVMEKEKVDIYINKLKKLNDIDYKEIKPSGFEEGRPILDINVESNRKVFKLIPVSDKDKFNNQNNSLGVISV